MRQTHAFARTTVHVVHEEDPPVLATVECFGDTVVVTLKKAEEEPITKVEGIKTLKESP